MTCTPTRIAALSLALMLAAGASAQSTPDDPLPPKIATGRFDKLHKRLLPSSDELVDFWDLPWEVNVQEARIKAAEQDKPILAYFGANGSVLGAT